MSLISMASTKIIKKDEDERTVIRIDISSG